MAVSLTGDGVQYPSGQTSKQGRPFIKWNYASTPGVNVSLNNNDWTWMPGCQVNMGVPESSNNWYRVEYYSVMDDWPGSSNGGAGGAIYRYTPSSGWNRVLDQGWHAQYENNANDFYTTVSGLYYIPVHPSYPTEEHQFRLYARRHPGTTIRWSCGIGADNRVGGWNNTLFEVAEVDATVAQPFTNMTRY